MNGKDTVLQLVKTGFYGPFPLRQWIMGPPISQPLSPKLAPPAVSLSQPCSCPKLCSISWCLSGFQEIQAVPFSRYHKFTGHIT